MCALDPLVIVLLIGEFAHRTSNIASFPTRDTFWRGTPLHCTTTTREQSLRQWITQLHQRSYDPTSTPKSREPGSTLKTAWCNTDLKLIETGLLNDIPEPDSTPLLYSTRWLNQQVRFCRVKAFENDMSHKQYLKKLLLA
jgi:hypothetical protein